MTAVVVPEVVSIRSVVVVVVVAVGRGTKKGVLEPDSKWSWLDKETNRRLVRFSNYELKGLGSGRGAPGRWV